MKIQRKPNEVKKIGYFRMSIFVAFVVVMIPVYFVARESGCIVQWPNTRKFDVKIELKVGANSIEKSFIVKEKGIFGGRRVIRETHDN